VYISLKPFFLREEDAMKFYLFLLANFSTLPKERNYVEDIQLVEYLPDLPMDFATLTYKICVPWVLDIPRCTRFTFSLRYLESHWYIIPPEGYILKEP
jgi:hypothetical protein